MPPETIIDSPGRLAEAFLADLDGEIRAAAPGRRFTFAIPGGSVAETFLPALARARGDWSSLDLFWTDERAVPPTARDSNYALAERLWLGPARVPAAQVHRMPAEEPDLDAAARRYAMELVTHAGPGPQLGYVLLGVGEDGHVASLFPGEAHSLIDPAAVTWTDHAPKPPPRRMSLTLPVLARATRVVVAAFGEGKARAMADAAAGRGNTPLALLLRSARRPLLLLDGDAASFLGR